MFNEKEVSEADREKLWKFYYDKLSGGVDVGIASSGFTIEDQALVQSLKQSIAKFSAFKETSFRKDLESLMTKDGKFVPWSEFKKEAYQLSGDYNHRWLETEYHQTVANANMAAKWKDFERNVDMYPNVKLVAVNDARVRPEHKVLDGTIRPYNDPFWDTHLPPLDWGCRCHVEQTDEEPTEIKGGVQMKIEFENNPAKSGDIFGGSVYENKITVSEEKEARENAEKWSKTINASYVVSVPYRDLRLKRYKGIKFEKIGDYKKGKLEKFVTGKQYKHEYAKNRNAFNLMAENGGKYRMLPVINDGDSNPDGLNLISRKFVDVKVTTSTKGINIIQNSLKEADEANCQEVIIHMTNPPTSYRDLYIGLKLDVYNGRNMNIEIINIIFPNGNIKKYDYKEIEKKIKARLK
jgi:SPP1 gp7 family putative phage head morphogenesis protein